MSDDMIIFDITQHFKCKQGTRLTFSLLMSYGLSKIVAPTNPVAVFVIFIQPEKGPVKMTVNLSISHKLLI